MNDAVFVALADPTGRHLLERLAMGPTTATGLSVRFPLTRQAVVKHLGAPLGEATAWLTTLSARWEQRLRRLKRYVEEES